MRIFGLKNCDTCRKVLKLIPNAQLVDVRSDGLPSEVLDAALAKFGEKLVNTRSTTWRSLDQEARDQSPSELIARYPALMKRPLIEAEGALFLGWTLETRAALGV